MKQAAFDKISGLNWNEISQRLTAVSVYWSKIYHGTKWNALPKGYTQEDIVQESIRRAFLHNWEHYDEKEFRDFLFGSVRSIVSNLARSSKVQKTDNMDLFDLPLEINSEEGVEEKFEKEEVIQRIRVELNGDVELTNLVDNILLGLEPLDIADKLQISIKQVYNLKKRLIRIVEKVAKEL